MDIAQALGRPLCDVELRATALMHVRPISWFYF